MEYHNPHIAPYAKAATKLLQGPVFENQEELWAETNKYRSELTQFFKR